MFQIALFEPRIAPNTGNIIRLIANNGCCLHLIEPLGFDFEEKKLRRAGLDYADLSEAFKEAVSGARILACTTKGSRPHDQIDYHEGDVLLFGSETAGLPEEVLESFPLENRLRIPMLTSSRSMNLSNAVAVVSFEAWRQHGFKGGL